MKEGLPLSRRELLTNGARIAAGVFAASSLNLLVLACDKGLNKPPALPKTETKPIFVPENYTSLRFLIYPCPNDKDIKIQQGWYSTLLDKDGKLIVIEHKAIDFIKGEIDKADTWKPFDVLAAADGWVCSNPPDHEGNALFMVHLVKGNFLHTYYGHLGEIKAGIPEYNAKEKFLGGIPVKRGEKIGVAGASGVINEKGEPEPTWIHLHFQVNLAGDIPVDPYDLRDQRAEYPNLNFANGKTLGQNTLWKDGAVQQ